MFTEKDSEIGTIAAIGPLGNPSHSKYERLIARAKQVPAATTVVVHPCDETSLRGATEAAQAGIIVPTLVGPAAKISAVAREHGLQIGGLRIVDVPHSEAAAAKAVQLIHESKGELLMKGSLHTDELMREVTSGKTGLRTARRISHVFIMDVPTYSAKPSSLPTLRSTFFPTSTSSAISFRMSSICSRRSVLARRGLRFSPPSRP